jgi:hypothetical protein
VADTAGARAGRPAGAAAWIWRRADAVLATAVAAACALKVLLAFRINVHWDEFYYLTFVHEHARGELAVRHQTLHVHLFSWLPRIESEIGQVIAGRLVMAMLAMGSAALIYGIARRFATRGGALFAVLGYLALSVTIEHGASFRTDPVATVLLLAALFLLIRRPGSLVSAIACGATLAVATLVTVKVALFFPLFALVAWCLLPRLRDLVRVGLAAGGAFALGGGALYLLHAASLAAADPVDPASFLQRTAAKVLFQDGLFLRLPELLVVIAFNPLFWIMAAEGGIAAWRAAWRTGERRAWVPLILALPVLIPVFYRNAFAYFFPFMLAPAAILIALFYEKHRRAAMDAGKGAVPVVLATFIAVQCGMLALHTARNLPDETGPQRTVLAAIHQVFPEPVPYIDGYGIVASFPRFGFFMSSWGLQNYHAAGQPVFAALVARHQPPLLIADSPSLYGALIPGVTVRPERALLPADVKFLNDTYLPHWGMLFVAGKRFEAAAGARAFEIAIAGDYRLEAEAPVRIDGEDVQPGAIIALAAGPHRIEAGAAAALRWAKALPPPAAEPVGLLTFFDKTYERIIRGRPPLASMPAATGSFSPLDDRATNR